MEEIIEAGLIHLTQGHHVAHKKKSQTRPEEPPIEFSPPTLDADTIHALRLVRDGDEEWLQLIYCV